MSRPIDRERIAKSNYLSFSHRYLDNIADFLDMAHH